MSAPPDPATRPSRLSPLAQGVITTLLAASFISGSLIWWGQFTAVPAPDDLVAKTPAWVKRLTIFHGWLFPFQCGLFGWLACQHFRVSWELRANVVSGFLMEGVFLALILTGTSLHYASDWRPGLIWAHRICGLLLPLTLAGHWWAGLSWAKRSSR